MQATHSGESISIREIAVADAEAAAGLSAELGYPAVAREIEERISQLSSSGSGVVYVASISNIVIGWIEVAVTNHLATGVSAEIAGFIVSSEYRSAGVGRRLLAQAENWVAARGIGRIIVRSRITREAAHRFYLREGYCMTKTSAVFSKLIKVPS